MTSPYKQTKRAGVRKDAQRLQRYVAGFLCKCGQYYPEIGPFAPFPPAPSVCPECGTHKDAMEKRALLETRQKFGFIFKTERVSYEADKSITLPCDRDKVMARQRLSSKKVAALRKRTGLPIVAALVRGGTDHRQDLCLEDGTIAHLYRDGTIEKTQTRHTYAIAPGDSR